MAEDFIEDIIASEKIDTVEVTKSLDEVKENKDTNIVAEVDKNNIATVAEVKELAKQLGWREDHTGDDAVDAATYILRSKDIQKSMSQHNKDLKDQLQALGGSVEALKKHNETVYKAEVKKLEAEVAVLKKERKSAIELADVDKVEELDKQIDELQKDINAPKITQTQTAPTDNPVYDEWIKDNQWYLQDDEMAMFADTVAQQYVGAPLERIYTMVKTKVQEVFPDRFEVKNNAQSQVKPPVIGPRSPVERSSAKGNGSSFSKADLTADQVMIMNQFVRGGIMTEEQYINDIAKMQE
jgi:DNA repair exonuclease SbcCD ATPase subunit